MLKGAQHLVLLLHTLVRVHLCADRLHELSERAHMPLVGFACQAGQIVPAGVPQPAWPGMLKFSNCAALHRGTCKWDRPVCLTMPCNPAEYILQSQHVKSPLCASCQKVSCQWPRSAWLLLHTATFQNCHLHQKCQARYCQQGFP